MWLIFLDKFLFAFHSFLVVFNLFGWLWIKTRKANLATLLLTGFSWFILGIWYGIGYCPLTHLHWEVKMKLGQRDLPDSYIKYLVDTLTGLDLHAQTLEWLTGPLFFIALAASIVANFMAVRKARS